MIQRCDFPSLCMDKQSSCTKKKEGTVARPTHDMAAMDASETGGFEFDPAPQMLAKKRLHGTHEC